MLSDNRVSEGSGGTSGSRPTFARDDRAIEGLPIRLVIALVVGVAALALMLNMLGTIGTVGDTEVTVEITTGQTIDDSGDETVELEVIDENGNDVEDATIMISAGSAQMEGVLDSETGTDSHIVNVETGDRQSLRADQDMGTLEIDIVPPSDSNYIDEQPNPEIYVTDD